MTPGAALQASLLQDRLYTARVQPSLVELPETLYLMIDGEGDPQTSLWYGTALQSLYALATPLKFVNDPDAFGTQVHPGPLEALWGDCDGYLNPHDRGSWQWTLMLRQPDDLSHDLLAEVRATQQRKYPTLPLDRVRLKHVHGGLHAQILHLGTHRSLRDDMAVLYQFISEHDLVPFGRQHEIYLTGPKETTPINVRTIFRRPVQPRDAPDPPA